MNFNKNKLKKFSLNVLLIFALMASSIFFSACDILEKDTRLQVHFIDVDQGDSTLIISPNGRTMLIDAGDNSKGSEVISYLKRKGISKIDILIGTHPDADHIGGLDDVIEAFEIGEFYLPRKSHTTNTFESVLLAAKSKGLSIKEGYADRELDYDENIKLKILSPIKSKDYGSDNNLYSIVVKLDYNQASFLFMGDAEYKNEYDMLASDYSLKSDVVKLGHHGSHSSTSQELLNAVMPSAAIVSCGYKNKYSHPHKEVLDLLETSSIPLYRTDEQGDIIFRTDGKTITANTEPGSYTYRKYK